MSRGYSSDEKEDLARDLVRKGEAECPRCGVAVERRSVPPRSEVAYVRDRIWVVCSECGASAVFDRREVERKAEE